MDLDIGNNLKIVNVDNNFIKQLKENNDTLENGAVQILAGLEEFIDVTLDNYDQDVPYELIFKALRQIITSALEKQSVLYAIMSGLIVTKKTETSIPKPAAKTENDTPKPEQKKMNMSAIKLYAKSHTVKEIYEHFDFSSLQTCRNFLYYHNIDFVRSNVVRTTNYDYESRVKELAKSMTLTELSRVFQKTISAMGMYCLRHNITHL